MTVSYKVCDFHVRRVAAKYDVLICATEDESEPIPTTHRNAGTQWPQGSYSVPDQFTFKVIGNPSL